MADDDPQGAARPVILGFFAHPDDETLSAGGALALLARSADVHLITATRGEMGEQVGPDGQRTTPDRGQLPITRAQEVRRASAELGARSHEFLDGGDGRFTDSGMAWEDERRVRAVPDPHAPAGSFSQVGIEEPARILAERIEELRPTLVLTEEPAGGYGHPDHIRCHDVTMRALEIAAPRWRVPYVAFTVQEEQRLRGSNAELTTIAEVPREDSYGLTLNLPDLRAPLRSGVRAEPDTVLDTSGAAPQLAAAMRAHRTQVHEVTEYPGRELAGWFALTNNDVKPIATHSGLMLAPGWGDRAGLRAFLSSLGAPLAPARRRGGGGLYTAFVYTFALLSGIIVGFAGSFTHRAYSPWGLLIALLAVFAGATMNRSIGTPKTAFTYAVGVIGAVLLVTTLRTGGDVIIVEDALGLGWLAGVFVVLLFGSLMGGPVASARRRGRARSGPSAERAERA